MLTGFKDKRYAIIGDVTDRPIPARLHRMLADYQYDCIPVKKSELKRMLSDKSFDGFNLAYPLKSAVMPYLDELSEAAEKIRVANTIVRREDGTLFGDNTDYTGFLALLDENNISPEGKKVIVLGSGDTSKAVASALLDRGADDVVIVSRGGDNDYSCLDMHDDAAILVNTTPVGMTPDYTTSPLSQKYLTGLETVIDIVYDPFRTELMLLAEENGVSAVGGMDMLKAHTRASCELFTGKKVTAYAVERALASLEAEMENVVLVGMPGCGKSVIARELAKTLGRTVYDTDDEVERAAGLGIPEIYELFGEEYFRQAESEIIKKVARGAGAVIAGGAGAILKEENIRELRRKSTVIFLRREIERLATSGARRASRDSLMKLYKERIPLYLAASDVIVDVGETPKDTVRSIIKAIYKK